VQGSTGLAGSAGTNPMVQDGTGTRAMLWPLGFRGRETKPRNEAADGQPIQALSIKSA